MFQPRNAEQRKAYVRQELTHSPPSCPEQVEAHKAVSDIYVEFGEVLAEVVPDCPDFTKMVNFLTLSRALAQKSIAQNFKPE